MDKYKKFTFGEDAKRVLGEFKRKL